MGAPCNAGGATWGEAEARLKRGLLQMLLGVAAAAEAAMPGPAASPPQQVLFKALPSWVPAAVYGWESGGVAAQVYVYPAAHAAYFISGWQWADLRRWDLALIRSMGHPKCAAITNDVKLRNIHKASCTACTSSNTTHRLVEYA